MNRKQTLALVAGTVIAGIVAAAVPATHISTTPVSETQITTPPGGGDSYFAGRTYIVYTPRKASLTLIAVGTLITVFALRNPKTPPRNP